MAEFLNVTVAGIDEVEFLEGHGNFTHVISVSDAELEAERGYEHMINDFFPTAQVLFSYFDDVEYARRHGGPTYDEIVRILLFTQPLTLTDKILVHCRAGVSRSTALAIAIVAQHSRPGLEKQAVAHVRTVRPQLIPNFLIVKLADEILGRNGKLVAAVAALRNVV
jgi:predicted protein tyrosine phosphatase